MKKKFSFLILLFINFMFAQDVSFFNKTFQLNDTISSSHEIRLYRIGTIMYESNLFRIFKNDQGNWQSILYKHYQNDNNSYIQDKIDLSNDNIELVFYELLKFKILVLPNEKSFDWEKSEIVIQEIEKHPKDLSNEKYEVLSEKIKILDGVSYKLMVQHLEQKNNIHYANPESYLEIYPHIYELQLLVNSIYFIKKIFKIW